MDDAIAWIDWFYRTWPVFGALVSLMVCDVTSGIVVAIHKKELNSQTSLRGVTRKVQILLACGVARIMEPHAEGIPLLNITAMFFCAYELISICENLAETGIPIPKSFRDLLSKFRDDTGELQVPAQTIVIKRPKRPSDFVELGTGPPKKESGDSPVDKTDEPP